MIGWLQNHLIGQKMNKNICIKTGSRVLCCVSSHIPFPVHVGAVKQTKETAAFKTKCLIKPFADSKTGASSWWMGWERTGNSLSRTQTFLKEKPFFSLHNKSQQMRSERTVVISIVSKDPQSFTQSLPELRRQLICNFVFGICRYLRSPINFDLKLKTSHFQLIFH